MDNYVSPYVAVEDLTLFAISTGKFYPHHLELTRRNATRQGWEHHVNKTVWPAYLREIDSCGIIMTDDIETVGLALAAHCRDELKERV